MNSASFDRLAVAIRGGSYKSDPVEIITALGFVQHALGDPRSMIDGSRNPESASIMDGYRSLRSMVIKEPLRSGWAKYCLNVADHASSLGLLDVAEEAVRTVAFFRPEASEVLDRLLARVTTQSHPTSDINVLCVIAASSFKPTVNQSEQIALAYAGVSEKIFTRQLPTDNRWSVRQQQLLESLAKADVGFTKNLIYSLPKLQAQALEWINWLPLPQQREAAAVVAKKLVTSEAVTWTASQLQVAGRFVLPAELANKMRQVAVRSIESPLQSTTTTVDAEGVEPAASNSADASNAALLVEFLAKTPTTADYDAFLLAASAPDRLLAKHGWSGLRKLPIQDPARELQAIALLAAANHVSGIEGLDTAQVSGRLKNIAVRMKLTTLPEVNADWAVWQAFFEPHLVVDEVRDQWRELQQPPAPWLEIATASKSLTGDAKRGSTLFKRGQCNQCHNSANSIGPSLNGVTRRFSHEDLFRAIYEPSRDVSDRFRATKILTTDGQVLIGMLAFESDEKVVLTLADGKNQEVLTEDIDQRAESTASLMPENLLQGWDANQLADLYEYLKGL